jgi:hypothetical protein
VRGPPSRHTGGFDRRYAWPATTEETESINLGGLRLFVIPGSAGPRRFRLPIAIGELIVQGRHAAARIVELSDARLLANLSANL